MRKFLLLVLVFVFSLPLHGEQAAAQSDSQSSSPERVDGAETETDEIETDRDSFTPATSTAGKGRVIFESAYSYIDNRTVEDTESVPEALIRFGVADRIELRFGVNYEEGGAGNPVSGNVPDAIEEDAKKEYSSRVLYGAKVKLSDQGELRPQSSVIVQGFTPTSGENMDSTLAATYVFGWTLPCGSVWDTALHYGTGGQTGDRFNTWSPSTVLKIPLGERWKVHAEYFGVFSDGRSQESTQHFISPGVHMLLTRNYEVGVRVGWGMNEQAPNFFSNAGIGYRF